MCQNFAFFFLKVSLFLVFLFLIDTRSVWSQYFVLVQCSLISDCVVCVNCTIRNILAVMIFSYMLRFLWHWVHCCIRLFPVSVFFDQPFSVSQAGWMFVTIILNNLLALALPVVVFLALSQPHRSRFGVDILKPDLFAKWLRKKIQLLYLDLPRSLGKRRQPYHHECLMLDSSKIWALWNLELFVLTNYMT